MSIDQRGLRESMRLMRAGDLQAATEAIQRGLRREIPADDMTATAHSHGPGPAPTTAVDPMIIDGEFEVIGAETPTAGAATSAGAREHFSHALGELDYRLFVPEGRSPLGMPLLLMLHGCTQSPDDFARGTRMNQLAAQHGWVVVWPEQTAQHNPNKCWNWFRHRDQQREQGEAALLSALVRQLLTQHRLEQRQVCVAGLSAGAAMASVLGQTQPELFTGLGLHSGLPAGIAHDLPSALAAMKQGPSEAPAFTTGVPCIVFQGDQDHTVNPVNATASVQQSMAGAGRSAVRATQSGAVPGGRRFTRTLFNSPNGHALAEHWLVHGAGHAWSGGAAAGTYTDPTGPDASVEMLRFFAGCMRG